MKGSVKSSVDGAKSEKIQLLYYKNYACMRWKRMQS